jgi:uncharacterized coiled-coil protein SlyX
MTDMEIAERVRRMQIESALHGRAIEKLEEVYRLQGEMIEKIKDTLTAVKVQNATFGVVNALIIAWIAYKITKGLP